MNWGIWRVELRGYFEVIHTWLGTVEVPAGLFGVDSDRLILESEQKSEGPRRAK